MITAVAAITSGNSCDPRRTPPLLLPPWPPGAHATVTTSEASHTAPSSQSAPQANHSTVAASIASTKPAASHGWFSIRPTPGNSTLSAMCVPRWLSRTRAMIVRSIATSTTIETIRRRRRRRRAATSVGGSMSSILAAAGRGRQPSLPAMIRANVGRRSG